MNRLARRPRTTEAGYTSPSTVRISASLLSVLIAVKMMMIIITMMLG